MRIGPCYREASQGLVNDGVGGCGGDPTSTVAKANRGGVIPCDDGGGVDVKMPVCQEEVDCYPGSPYFSLLRAVDVWEGDAPCRDNCPFRRDPCGI